MMTWRVVLLVCVVCVALSSATPVTCGSTIKLKHIDSGYRLHSHAVAYGSGSGQQSVTAVSEAADSNSLWMIKEAIGAPSMCLQSTPIACNSQIRLQHAATRKFLHSHQFTSPLSGQQEISAFGDGEGGGSDTSDNWEVQCSDSHWQRDQPVRLRHVVTGVYLSTGANHRFTHHNCPNCPIINQQEVAGTAHQQPAWRTDEGIYFVDESNMQTASSHDHDHEHDEL